MINKLLKLYAESRVNYLDKINLANHQENILLNLLNKNKSTLFGRDHKFESIKSVSEYQKNVPIRTYEDFWNSYFKDKFPYLKNITCTEQPSFFSVSSGTTSGKTKYIPYTNSLKNSNTRAGIDLLVWHAYNNPKTKLLSGKNFILGGSTELIEEAPNIFSGDLSGIAVKTLPLLIRPFYYPPKNLALIKNWEEKIDSLANDSIKQRISLLAGIPSWLLIFFEKLFEITSEDKIAKIFPNLETLIHGGVNFTPYYSKFKKLLGDQITLREVYPASEGFIAINDRGYGEGLRLNIDHGIFFEFIPFDELGKENPTRHWIKNIELDTNYAVVMTTPGGLYSYLIGDTVKFIDREPGRLLVTGRTSYMLSAFGEHVIGSEIETAINYACEKMAVTVTDYSVGAKFPDQNSTLGKHAYVIEFDNLQDHFDKDYFIELVDNKLRQLNEDYEAHRSDGFGMNPPELITVKTGFFASWMKSRGKLGGQHKVPRIINNTELFENLLSYNY